MLVLERELQDGNSIPKFSKHQSHIGVYFGHLPHHAGNVVLVYNPKTGLVSPQFHVVFDEAFTTVESDDPSKIEENIQKMFNEKIEVFSPVEFSKVSILTGIVKIGWKTLLECVRLRTFSR